MGYAVVGGVGMWICATQVERKPFITFCYLCWLSLCLCSASVRARIQNPRRWMVVVSQKSQRHFLSVQGDQMKVGEDKDNHKKRTICYVFVGCK